MTPANAPQGIPTPPDRPETMTMSAGHVATYCPKCGGQVGGTGTNIFCACRSEDLRAALEAVKAENARLNAERITAAVDAMPDGTTLIKTEKLDALRAQLAAERNARTLNEASLMAKLAEAQKDSARLDWLEAKANGWQGVMREQIDNEDIRLDWVGDETSGLKSCSSWGRTVREAIDDAARSGRKETE